MKTYTPAQLKKILETHRKWREDYTKGSRANLGGADLRRADLGGADLGGAYLRSADLRGADLRSADLGGADLGGADLRGANLGGADLRRADLGGADLGGAKGLVGRSVCPPVGAFTAFKKVAGDTVLELLIPADAERISALVGRKCRASKAIVVRVASGPESALFYSKHDQHFIYRVGQTVEAPLDKDNRIECTSGIHFFMEQAEAEEY